MKNIAVIGLGNMGSSMAINLLKNNQNVYGFDIDEKLVNNLSNYNIIKVKSLKDIPCELDIVLTMLPDGNIVEDVLNEVLPRIKNNTIIVDCSTIDVKKAQSLYHCCAKKNISFLDAPVSGGTRGAKEATLTFMVGGEKKVFDKVTSLLNLMGSKAIYCGNTGSGQAAKLCNNMLLATTMIGVSESFNMAKNLNLNLNTLFDVISTATGSCWAINNYCPIENVGPISPADNNFLPGFSAKLMSKDLKLAAKAAKDSKTKIQFGKMAENIYSKMANGKNADKDFSAVIKEL